MFTDDNTAAHVPDISDLHSPRDRQWHTEDYLLNVAYFRLPSVQKRAFDS